MIKNNSVILKDELKVSETKNQNRILKVSVFIIEHLEDFFYWYGYSIAKKPYHFIIFWLLVTLVSSAGLLKFSMEERPFKLWIPQDSDFIKSMEWQKYNFPEKFRSQMVIYEADNVLNKKMILELFHVHELVSKTSTPTSTWQSVCAKIPILPSNPFFRKKRDLPWWSSLLSREDMCKLNEVLDNACLENSLLEIWGYDKYDLDLLTDEDIIQRVNDAEVSAIYGTSTNFTQFLGGIQRDENGRIISAKAMLHIWIAEKDVAYIEEGESVYDKWTGMMIDKKLFEWEKQFVSNVLNYSQSDLDYNLYVMSASSFGLVTESTIEGDSNYFAVGFFLVFVYAQIMLGKFNLIEMRPVLSLCGLMCVGFAILISYGICSAIGVMFGPVNNALPFLLLGLGVDDMFVIIQSFNNLNPKEKELDLPSRIAYTMKHAGVSITITSLTDVVAFAIGATTILPALQSFCLYAAMGITFIYLLQSSFFVAWLTLDQRRLEDNRLGFLWCIKLKTHSSNEFSQKDFCQMFFKDIYSKYLLLPSMKTFILIFTFGILAVSSWGLYNLEQEFHPIWFLPQNTYIFKFFNKLNTVFQSDGDIGRIFFGNLSFDDFSKLSNISSRLLDNEYIGRVDNWYDSFQTFWIDSGNDINDIATNETVFQDAIGEFLFSPYGSKYRIRNFMFNGNLSCNEAAPSISAFAIDFKHKVISGSRHKIRAMESLKDIVTEANFSGYAQPWALIYSGWETDKVIEIELYRNMGLALFVIGIMMLALIASFVTSSLVLVCVLMTLVDVGGLMHWWGLTIDTVSCIDLVLAIGLCVDYAAHIGHTFMTQEGSRDQRTRDTLAKIGPAVLNGGLSNVLAFVFLAGSDSHVFKTFFKIFFGVSLYGLFHGLVFLPVLLSLVGPASYGSTRLEEAVDSFPITERKPEEEERCLNSSTDNLDNVVFYGNLEQLKYCKETAII